MENSNTEKFHISSLIQGFVFSSRKMHCISVFHHRFIINFDIKGAHFTIKNLEFQLR